MQTSITSNGKDTLVKFEGSLDVSCQESLKNELAKQVQPEDQRLVVDLSLVTFIDSACLGVFVSTLKNLKAKNRQLVFVAPQEEVRSIFQITRLDRLFMIVDSLKDLPPA